MAIFSHTKKVAGLLYTNAKINVTTGSRSRKKIHTRADLAFERLNVFEI